MKLHKEGYLTVFIVLTFISLFNYVNYMFIPIFIINIILVLISIIFFCLVLLFHFSEYQKRHRDIIIIIIINFAIYSNPRRFIESFYKRMEKDSGNIIPVVIEWMFMKVKLLK